MLRRLIGQSDVDEGEGERSLQASQLVGRALRLDTGSHRFQEYRNGFHAALVAAQQLRQCLQDDVLAGRVFLCRHACERLPQHRFRLPHFPFTGKRRCLVTGVDRASAGNVHRRWFNAWDD